MSFEDSICFICVVKLISIGWSEVFLFVVPFPLGTAALLLFAVREASPSLCQTVSVRPSLCSQVGCLYLQGCELASVSRGVAACTRGF